METTNFLFVLQLLVIVRLDGAIGETLVETENARRLGRDLSPEKNFNTECDKSWRLPKNVVPRHYDVILRINPQILIFNGTVKIDIECNEDTDLITMHSKDLDLTLDKILVKIKSKRESSILAANVTFDYEREMVFLRLRSPLVKGTIYILKIRDFVGKVHEKEHGLFRKTYKENGKRRHVVGSQLEHTYARMVFPCFDEPNMKATFTMKIVRPEAYKSFSNMPLDTTIPTSQNRVMDTFQETVILPTYTLAVLVGNYSKYPKNERDFTHILAPEQDLKSMDLAYRVATDALRELKTYINVSTPLSKVDHVSLRDFAPSGMENWGLIMYQYDYMVKEDNMLSLSTQEGFTFMVHELAHVWFGNMVTVEWWSYVWLNEGFSTFLQFFITDKIFPEWRLLDQFIISQLQTALKADADPHKSKPALTSTVCSSKEIEDFFDEISYCKGASLLRMFIGILGDDKFFQEAIKLYLQRWSMKTVQPADWFQVLDEVNLLINKSVLPTNVSFADIGATWAEQPGFPIITVTRNYDSNITGSNIVITQERFFDQRYVIDSDKKKEIRWWVPLTWTTTSSRNFSKEWLYDDKNISLKVPNNEWLLFNANATGYYRVNYDIQNWHLITQSLQKSRNDIPVINRAQLLDDAFSLAFAHQLSFGTALNLTRFLKDEDDVLVWMSACKQFQNVYELLGSTSAYPRLQKYVQRLTRKIYRRVRLEVSTEEPHLEKILRFTVAPIACLYGLDVCLTDSQDVLSHFLAESTSEEESSPDGDHPELHPDIESVVLCGGIQSGGTDIFEQLRALALDEHVPGTDHTASYLAALSCTNEHDLIIWHLNDIIDNNTHFEAHEALQAMKHFIETARTFDVASEYFQTNIDKVNHYLDSQNMTEELVQAMFQQLRTKEQYKKMHDWISSVDENDLENKDTLLQDLETKESEINWSSESIQQIMNWLKTSATTFLKENVTKEG